MTFMVAPLLSSGQQPGVGQPPYKQRVLNLSAVRVRLGQQLRRPRFTRKPSNTVLLVRLCAYEDVLTLHFKVVHAKVDEHTLKLVAVLANRPTAVLLNDVSRHPRLNLALQDVTLHLKINRMLPLHLLVQGRKLNTHDSPPSSDATIPHQAPRRHHKLGRRSTSNVQILVDAPVC